MVKKTEKSDSSAISDDTTPSKKGTGSQSAAKKSAAKTKKSAGTAETSKTPAKKPAAKKTAAADAAAETLTAASPTQLVFAGPDPELFQKFQEAAEPAERNVRKRQRQRGGATEGEPSAPKTRARKTKDEPATEPQRVRGSTRLEAKRQRRREGRDQGRRRAVVTESEFLARRESVERVMVVREKDSRTQIAVLEDGVTVEHYVAKNDEASLIGNVYLGRVQNVLPSMEAAFVDIGRGRNAVLYSGEVDWDAATEEGGERPKKIEAALKTGDSVLVQVTKDPVGHKGARLTSQISLPGRYLVYVPSGGMNGISRKLPDTERARLKAI